MAVAIGAITLFFSNKLAKEIASEEKKKIEIWANAAKQLNDTENDGDLTFQLDVITSNTTIPALILDENGGISAHINLNKKRIQDSSYLLAKLAEFKKLNEPIVIPVTKTISQKVYYGESSILVRIRNYPFYALALVSLFVVVSYFAFSFSRRAEENRVWVGLAKETAHQLGTPISSLMGWIQFLELELGQLPNDAVKEMEKDIDRLKVITQRFSKIGSEPELEKLEANTQINEVLDYMDLRFGRNVEIVRNLCDEEVYVDLNQNLFHWVIENLVKNSIDAMKGQGKISCQSYTKNNKFIINIEDNGSGIPANRFKTIFKPGFTTKKRGWGLGLSLARRIVKQYHKGEIFVRGSIPNKKTVISIVLKKSES